MQTVQWTNQNSNQIHVTGAKRGKTRASKSRLVLVPKPITKPSKAKPKETRNCFRHSNEKCTKEWPANRVGSWELGIQITGERTSLTGNGGVC